MRQLKKISVLMTLGVTGAAALIPFAPPASAATAEPAIYAQAWYWETQQNQTVDTPAGTVAVQVPNPFCPEAPGSLGAQDDTCAKGRLPVEVIQGDYKTPDKLSALTFDLSSVPIGSTVTDFKVSFLEAESGCYENEDATSKQQCEQTDARDAEGHELMACLVTEQFGEGDARPYKELPKYSCDGAPTAERKEVKNDEKEDPTDTDPDHVWNFNLTAYGQEWLETGTFDTSILIHPSPGKEGKEDDPGDSWRVVLAGPRLPGGVKTSISFVAPKNPITPPPPPTTTDPSGGFVPSSDFGGSSGTTFGGTTVGSTEGGPVGGSDPAPDGVAPSPGAPETEPAAEIAAAPIESMPGYVWLAILAGLIAFSLVRSLVLEPAHGHRPDGVLAQIHKLNAQRRGVPATASDAGAAGPLAALRGGVGSVSKALEPVRGAVAKLVDKLPIGRKG
ncbi:MAG: hypothetical protein M3345_07055 [Actinomycetota bacterium]|nr:hypothetical protein [Actinomycetota bacterium]